MKALFRMQAKGRASVKSHFLVGFVVLINPTNKVTVELG